MAEILINCLSCLQEMRKRKGLSEEARRLMGKEMGKLVSRPGAGDASDPACTGIEECAACQFVELTK